VAAYHCLKIFSSEYQLQKAAFSLGVVDWQYYFEE
jgi:hypothetical protein